MKENVLNRTLVVIGDIIEKCIVNEFLIKFSIISIHSYGEQETSIQTKYSTLTACFHFMSCTNSSWLQ